MTPISPDRASVYGVAGSELCTLDKYIYAFTENKAALCGGKGVCRREIVKEGV